MFLYLNLNMLFIILKGLDFKILNGVMNVLILQ